MSRARISKLYTDGVGAWHSAADPSDSRRERTVLQLQRVFLFKKKDLDGPAAMDDDAAHCRGRAVPLRWMARSSSLSKIDRRLLATLCSSTL